MRLSTSVKGQNFTFKSVKEVMAKANELKSGDVLAGVLGAFLCQLPAEWAAETAVWAHSLAGKLCAERLGEYGMNPTDLIDALPEATKRMTAEE